MSYRVNPGAYLLLLTCYQLIRGVFFYKTMQYFSKNADFQRLLDISNHLARLPDNYLHPADSWLLSLNFCYLFTNMVTYVCQTSWQMQTGVTLACVIQLLKGPSSWYNTVALLDTYTLMSTQCTSESLSFHDISFITLFTRSLVFVSLKTSHIDDHLM